jgi:preprotein translocase SecE subunit
MRQIVQFLKEVQTEFKNISWPKKESLIQLTFVVISISIIISLILGGFDYIFTQSINLLGQPTVTTTKPAVIVPTPQVTLSPTINFVLPTPKLK